MDLDHEFTVPVGVDAAWDILTDVPRVARCMPGATLDEGTRDPYTGSVAVKVGAITVRFRGEARFSERDDANHKLALDCEGDEVRGASSASASIAMQLEEVSFEETRVYVRTTLQLSGKVAQFGRGVLQDVSNAILRKFVANIKSELGYEPSSVEASRPEGATGERVSSSASAEDSGDRAYMGAGSRARQYEEVVDLGAAALPALWSRYGPTTLSLLALAVALRSLARSRVNSGRRCQTCSAQI